MLRDSTVAVAAAVVRTRPRAIPLMGFLLFPIYGLLMGLRLAALRAAGAPLKMVGELLKTFTFSFSVNT